MSRHAKNIEGYGPLALWLRL